MALARVKAYWTDMEATIIATQDPAGGQYPAEQLGTGHRRCPPNRGAVLEECPLRLISRIIVKNNVYFNYEAIFILFA